jgi:ATP phosphoribosyltransferase
VKPSDVAIYVERGAADIGVAGKDILLEYSPEVYELLDLNIGKCDMAVAAKADFVDDRKKTLTVATKFQNIAKAYYSSLGRDIDIIHLNGSIELAPILGLSDVIVDIVETGATLRENKLEVVEKFVPISARLISNKASFKFKGEIIEKVVKELSLQTENK